MPVGPATHRADRVDRRQVATGSADVGAGVGEVQPHDGVQEAQDGPCWDTRTRRVRARPCRARSRKDGLGRRWDTVAALAELVDVEHDHARVYLDLDRALRSSHWHERTARRAAALRAVFQALEADLAGRAPRRAKDGPGRWTLTALDDTGDRALVATVTAPIPRRWTDPEIMDVTVRGDLLPWTALRRLREPDRHVEYPAAEDPQRAHEAAGRGEEHERYLDTDDAAADHVAGKVGMEDGVELDGEDGAHARPVGARPPPVASGRVGSVRGTARATAGHRVAAWSPRDRALPAADTPEPVELVNFCGCT